MSNTLAVDIGTSSIKAALVTKEGEVEELEVTPITEEMLTIGRQYQDAFTNSFNKIKQSGKKIDCICVSGNGPTLITDRGFGILWNNPLIKQVDGRLKELGYPLLSTPSAFIKSILTLRLFYSQEYLKAKFILSSYEALIYFLTGSLYTALPTSSFKEYYWDTSLLKTYDLDPNKFPPFTTMGSLAGLYSGIPVVYGAPDYIASLIGAGIKEGALCDRSGSSEGINLLTSRKVEKKGIRCYPLPAGNLWSVSVVLEESGSALQTGYAKGIKEGRKAFRKVEKNVRKGIVKLKRLARLFFLSFPNKMTITGGQSLNYSLVYSKARANRIDISVMYSPYTELIGDAIISAVSRKVYPDVVSASKVMSRERVLFCKKERKYKERVCAGEAVVYLLPKTLTTIIFDIDSTLYTNLQYKKEQNECQIRAFCVMNKISYSEGLTLINDYQREYKERHGGATLTLGKSLLHFGLSIDKIIELRKTLLNPSLYLQEDLRLKSVLLNLKKRYKLGIVTNNPLSVANKTLNALGLEGIFNTIIGIDTLKLLKPSIKMFNLALKEVNSLPSTSLSVGDRFTQDLEPFLKLGGGAVGVNGVSGVYLLEKILGDKYGK